MGKGNACPRRCAKNRFSHDAEEEALEHAMGLNGTVILCQEKKYNDSSIERGVILPDLKLYPQFDFQKKCLLYAKNPEDPPCYVFVNGQWVIYGIDHQTLDEDDFDPLYEYFYGCLRPAEETSFILF